MVQTELGKTALDIIVDILESYLEFIAVVEYTSNFADMPYQIERRLANTVKERKEKWGALLQDIKKDLEGGTDD